MWTVSTLKSLQIQCDSVVIYTSCLCVFSHHFLLTYYYHLSFSSLPSLVYLSWIHVLFGWSHLPSSFFRLRCARVGHINSEFGRDVDGVLHFLLSELQTTH